MTLDSGSGAGGDGEPPFGGAYGRLKLLLLLAVAVLLVVGVFALVGKVAGYTRTLNRLKDAEPLWLSVCFVSQVLMYFGYVSVVRAIVRHDGGPTLRPWLATKVVLASLGATRLLGAGGAGGLAILYWLLRQIGNTRREAAVRVLAFNTLLFAWFGAAAAAAALLALLSARGDVPPAMTVPWLAGVAACAAAAAWLSAPGRSRRLAAAPGGGRARQGLVAAVAGVVAARGMLGGTRVGVAAPPPVVSPEPAASAPVAAPPPEPSVAPADDPPPSTSAAEPARSARPRPARPGPAPTVKPSVPKPSAPTDDILGSRN